MRTVPQELITESLKLDPDGTFLWVIEFFPNNSQAIYLVNNAEGITFDGKDYEPAPFEFQIQHEESTGDIASASLVVSNVQQILTQHIENNRGFTDKPITLRRLHSEYLDNADVHDSFDLTIREATVNELVITFALAGENYYQQRIPFDKFRRSYCSWVFNFPARNGHKIAITAATNASPIVITTDGHHGLETGQVLYIDGVLGNTAANGTFFATYVGENQLSLQGSSGNGAYTSGGTLLYATGPDCGYTGQSQEITSASNASPIVVTTKSDHPIKSGMKVTISGVSGNSAANGTFAATVTGERTFTIPAAGVGSGTGGSVSFYLPTCARTFNGPNGCSAHKNSQRIRLAPGTLKA